MALAALPQPPLRWTIHLFRMPRQLRPLRKRRGETDGRLTYAIHAWPRNELIGNVLRCVRWCRCRSWT